MRTKNIIILLILVLGFVVFVLWKYTHGAKIPTISSQTQPIGSYPDEPDKQDKIHPVSETVWTVPKKPEIIKPDNQQAPTGTFSAEAIWKDNPFVDLKQDMDKLHIDQKYYSYFYDNTLIPVASGEAKLIGDGKLFPYFQSIGVGCGSCETQYISMFIHKTLYSTATEYGTLTSRTGGKGFYLVDLTSDYASNTKTEILRRFDWDGNGFIEVGRKTIRFILQTK